MTEPTRPFRTPTEKPLEDAPDTDVFPDTWDDAPERSSPAPRTPRDPAPAIPSQTPL